MRPLSDTTEAGYAIFRRDRQQDSHRIEVLEKLIDACYAYLKAMHMILAERSVWFEDGDVVHGPNAELGGYARQ